MTITFLTKILYLIFFFFFNFLPKVYVKVNQDIAHEVTTNQIDNPDSMYQQGRQIFQKMETGINF